MAEVRVDVGGVPAFTDGDLKPVAPGNCHYV